MAKNRPAPGSRNAPAAPSRLPSTRERRPALAALAVLLIVGGALTSGWLAIRAGDRVEFLQVSQEVAQGQQIGEDDLEEVRLPRGFDGVPSFQRDQVEGMYASTRLLPGTVLSGAMLNKDGGVPAGTARYPIPVTPAVARTLTSGALVVLSVEGPDGGEPQNVVGEVDRLPETGDDGGLSSGDSEVTVLVNIGARCLGTVATGVRDDTVQVALIGDADSAGLGDACRRS